MCQRGDVLIQKREPLLSHQRNKNWKNPGDVASSKPLDSLLWKPRGKDAAGFPAYLLTFAIVTVKPSERICPMISGRLRQHTT